MSAPAGTRPAPPEATSDAAPGPPSGATPYDVRSLSIEDCGPAVPAWMLRLVVGAVAAGIVAILGAEGSPIAVQVVFGLLALSCMVSPSSAAPAGLSGGAALVSTVYNTGDMLASAVLGLVVLVHLLHVLSGVAAVVPRGARVHLTVLRRPLLRFAVIQAAVFALAGIATLAPAGRNPVLVEIGAVLGVSALAVLAIAQLRRR